MADFSADEVEDGTAKAGALVYENVATITAADGWLDSRQYPSLIGGTEATQKAAMLKATDKVESALSGFLNAVPTSSAQGRLLPLAGAYNYQGDLMPLNTIPTAFLEGWRLACEKEHAGTLTTQGAALAGVKSVSVDDTFSVTLRDGSLPDPVVSDREIWGRLVQMTPPR